MASDVQRMKVIKRGLGPAVALFLASSPGISFPIRCLYISWAAGAWVYGKDVQPHERNENLRNAFFTAVGTLALSWILGPKAVGGQKSILSVQGSTTSAATRSAGGVLKGRDLGL